MLKSSSPVVTTLAFAAVISLIGCGAHKSNYKPKAGDAKTTDATGAVAGSAGGIRLSMPTLRLSSSGENTSKNDAEATIQVVDGSVQMTLDIQWRIGSSAEITRTAGAGMYTVSAKCANDDCTQYAMLFSIHSANPAYPGQIEVGVLYENYSDPQVGVLIVKDVPYCSWTSIDDATEGLLNLADKDPSDNWT